MGEGSRGTLHFSRACKNFGGTGRDFQLGGVGFLERLNGDGGVGCRLMQACSRCRCEGMSLKKTCWGGAGRRRRGRLWTSFVEFVLEVDAKLGKRQQGVGITLGRGRKSLLNREVI